MNVNMAVLGGATGWLPTAFTLTSCADRYIDVTYDASLLFMRKDLQQVSHISLSGVKHCCRAKCPPKRETLRAGGKHGEPWCGRFISKTLKAREQARAKNREELDRDLSIQRSNVVPPQYKMIRHSALLLYTQYTE